MTSQRVTDGARFANLPTMRAFVLTLVAACASTDYGPPTAQTEIQVSEDGGFAGPANTRSVHVIGTTAAYARGSRTATQPVSNDNVAAMIHALEMRTSSTCTAASRPVRTRRPMLRPRRSTSSSRRARTRSRTISAAAAARSRIWRRCAARSSISAASRSGRSSVRRPCRD